MSAFRNMVDQYCEKCLHSEILDWDWDEKNKKSIPDYWCEKHKQSCKDILACNDLDPVESEDKE